MSQNSSNAPNPSTSYEFARVAESSNTHNVVFKNGHGELEVPVARFLTGDYAAWQDKSVLSTQQVQLAAAEVVKLGL